jgi:hypothetical protein
MVSQLLGGVSSRIPTISLIIWPKECSERYLSGDPGFARNPRYLSEGRLTPMRRRGRSYPMGPFYGGGASHSTTGLPDDNFVGPPYQNSKVPEEWRKHAREPWRILFPDLEWTPPERDL